MWILYRLCDSISYSAAQRERGGREVFIKAHTHTLTCTLMETQTHTFVLLAHLEIALRLMWTLCRRHIAQTQQVCLQMPRVVFYRSRIQTTCTSRVHTYTHLRCCEADSGWTGGVSAGKGWGAAAVVGGPHRQQRLMKSLSALSGILRASQCFTLPCVHISIAASPSLCLSLTHS